MQCFFFNQSGSGSTISTFTDTVLNLSFTCYNYVYGSHTLHAHCSEHGFYQTGENEGAMGGLYREKLPSGGGTTPNYNTKLPTLVAPEIDHSRLCIQSKKPKTSSCAVA